jgi:hypothetical protein
VQGTGVRLKRFIESLADIKMLQIISGKFFKSDVRQTSPSKGIFYSNYSWVGVIQTCVATLEPVDTFGSSICSYVVNYTNQIEGEPRPGALAPTGDWEIIRQFQLLCTYGLKAAFDVDRSSIELNCREKRKHSGDQYLPSKFTTRFFNPVINGNNDEVESFIKLIDKVIGLPRKQYLAVIRCLTNFLDALQALNFNLDLAYSMLVYSLEALSQNFDGYQPTWKDHPQNEEMDKLLLKVDEISAEEIRTLLITDKHLKLTKRFVDFISDHIDDSFYFEEATTIQNALRKSDLEEALRNVYKSRSKYVHSLSPVPAHLKYSRSTEGDVFYWDKQPYLTFNGLVRLTHHVITNFIASQEYIEREDYDYFQDIPGILTYRVAPEYWLGNEQHFSVSQAREWLSSFLGHLQATIFSGQPLVNMEKIIEKIEANVNVKGVTKEHQISMLVLHKLFCCLTGNDERYALLEVRYSTLLSECHIESMVASLILNQPLPWDLSECIKNYENYSKNRFKKNTIYIPRLIEIFLIIEIANMGLRNGIPELYETWLTTACLEAAGIPTIQSLIKNSMAQKVEVQLNDVVKCLQQPSQPQSDL